VKTSARISRGWVIGCWVAGVALYLFSPGLSVILSFLARIAFLVLLYQAWASIQDGCTGTSAGRAIGLLFVPFFNLYWVFVATRGFAKAFNSYVDRHGLATRKLEPGLFTLVAVYAVMGLAPRLLGALEFLVWLLFGEAVCFVTIDLARVIDAPTRDRPNWGPQRVVA
jgi:hypothetical protein